MNVVRPPTVPPQPGRPTDAAAALDLRVVSAPFGDGVGLSDVSLRVEAGERLAIVGPSGVGKTTLLRVAAGLAPLHQGRVLVAGRDVTALPPEQRGVVYLHQAPALFPHLAVGENVAFALRVRGQRGETVRERVRAALAAVKLDGFEARPSHALSGGQRHRVALARAIAARPGVLLLDEPLAALDPALRAEVGAAIVAAQAEYGPAMLLVSHDLEDVGTLADRVAVLVDGGIAQCAAPEVLFARPATLAVARFLGIYQELPGHPRADGAIACALGVIDLPRHLQNAVRPGSGVTVAFRADALRVASPGAHDNDTRARVVGVRHRPRGSTVVVRVEDGARETIVEAALDSRRGTPAVGVEVGIALDPCGVVVYPS